jgi:hypothetical protein
MYTTHGSEIIKQIQAACFVQKRFFSGTMRKSLVFDMGFSISKLQSDFSKSKVGPSISRRASV